jgi:hypothetical protein
VCVCGVLGGGCGYPAATVVFATGEKKFHANTNKYTLLYMRHHTTRGALPSPNLKHVIALAKQKHVRRPSATSV